MKLTQSNGKSFYNTSPLGGVSHVSAISSRLSQDFYEACHTKNNLPSDRWFSSSNTLLITKQIPIALAIDKLKFNPDGMSALYLPPFQEILDIVKSSGDLTIDHNRRVLIRDITGSDFYKVPGAEAGTGPKGRSRELYKTIDNLEPGGYSISFCFYTVETYPGSGLLYFNVDLNNNLSVMNQEYRNIGYVSWLTIIVYTSGKTEDLFSTVISIYKAMDSNVKDLNSRDTGGEINFKLNTLVWLNKLSSEQLKLFREKSKALLDKKISSLLIEDDTLLYKPNFNSVNIQKKYRYMNILSLGKKNIFSMSNIISKLKIIKIIPKVIMKHFNKKNALKHFTVINLTVAFILALFTLLVKFSGISGFILSCFINSPPEWACWSLSFGITIPSRLLLKGVF